MQRYLIAINYDGPHERLAAEVRALSLADDAQFHVVVPAGDESVFAAIGDELARHRYDVLVIATPPIGEHEQVHLIGRFVRVYGLPVIHVTAPGSTWLERHGWPMGSSQEGASHSLHS